MSFWNQEHKTQHQESQTWTLSKPNPLFRQKSFPLAVAAALNARPRHSRQNCAPAATFPTCRWPIRLVRPKVEGPLPANLFSGRTCIKWQGKPTCKASISRTLRRIASSALPRKSSMRLIVEVSCKKRRLKRGNKAIIERKKEKIRQTSVHGSWWQHGST